jgi:predicted ATP-dependent serine protease
VKLRRVDQQGAVPMALIQADRTPRLSVPGFPGIESAMNGGFVPGSVTVVYGGAGVGKSALMLKLVDRMTRILPQPALYCSTEQTPEHVKLTGYRAGVGGSRMLIAYETHVEAIERLLVKQRFAVIDSLSNLVRDTPITAVTGRLVEMARAHGTALVLVLHETKDGDYNAPRQVEHLVDCMVRLSHSEEMLDGVKPALVWSVQGKYRFGPINRSVVLAYDAHGVPYDPDAGSRLEYGQRDYGGGSHAPGSA